MWIILILVIISVAAIYLFNKDNEIEEQTSTDTSSTQITGSNGAGVNVSEISFENMEVDDDELELTDEQKTVIEYFDSDYFWINNYEDLQRYPKVYKGAKIYGQIIITKVIKSTDDEFEALAIYTTDDYTTELEDIAEDEENNYIIIKGNQLDERIMAGDCYIMYGRYVDIETTDIDGTSYTIPSINIFNLYTPGQESHRFSDSTIRTVASYIFGDDYELRNWKDLQEGVDYDLSGTYDFSEFYDVIVLENQSNVNFKAFNMGLDWGYIIYNPFRNGLSENVQKNLFISADFEHYIVSNYTSGTECVTISYYDKDYSKLWSQDYDLASNGTSSTPMDYTSTRIAYVIDNDLYLKDIETGEDIFEPILVGSKVRVVMMSEGILLVGDDNKDAIMFVDYDGNIKVKMNADTEITEINSAGMQSVNGNMVIKLSGYNSSNEYAYKYIVLNEDNEIEFSTSDINYWN